MKDGEKNRRLMTSNDGTNGELDNLTLIEIQRNREEDGRRWPQENLTIVSV